MNDPDFTKWWSDFTQRFPSMFRWFDGLSDGPEGQAFQKREGAKILRDVKYDDACEVNRLMQSAKGEYNNGRWRGSEFPPIGTYDSQRERWAAHVRTLVWDLHRSRTPTIKVEDHRGSRPRTEDSANSACSRCADTGKVFVWAMPYCYGAWQRGEIHETKHQRMVTRYCPCSWPVDTTDIYEPRRDCLEGTLELFIEWCQDRQMKQYELDNPEETRALF